MGYVILLWHSLSLPLIILKIIEVFTKYNDRLEFQLSYIQLKLFTSIWEERTIFSAIGYLLLICGFCYEGLPFRLGA